MIAGRCLCGAVRFEVDGALHAVAYCHCSQCRRANGSAFAANANAATADFRLLSADTLREYESSPGKFRAFCATCGSPIYSRWTAHPELRRIRLGTVDGDPGVRPAAHFWVGSKAAWYTIADALPQIADGGAKK